MGVNQRMEIHQPKIRKKTVNKAMANNSEVRKEFWGQVVENDQSAISCKYSFLSF
jgi:hypothetical protein